MNKTLRNWLAASTTLAMLAVAPAAHAERLIVFGDSLSDGGFFTTVLPAAAFEPGEGSFTTNPDDVAPEVLGSGLGLDLDIAYTAGGVPDGGFNYAIGGARVTSANPLIPGVPFSVTQQVDTFLATGRRFGDDDIVYIQGGGNDLFNLGDPGSPDFGNFPLFLSAATDLAAQVERIENAGAGTVVTLNVQSAGNTTTQAFNAQFEASLAAQGTNALFFDTDQLFNEIIFDALTGGSTFGITNITGTACTPGLSSLFCSQGDLVAPDADKTFALADTVHPTGVVQRIQGQAIASLVRAPDQIGELSNAAQALFRGHSALNEAAWRNRRPLAPAGDGATGESGFAPATGPGISVFAGAGFHEYDTDAEGVRSGLNQQAGILTLGVDVPLLVDMSAGASLSYGGADGDFESFTGADEGDLKADAFAVSAYLRGAAGNLRYVVDGTYGHIEYDIERNVALGPAVRSHRGETDGDYFGIRAQVEADAFERNGFFVGPTAGLLYDRVDLDGFTDSSGATLLSTNIAFGGQETESLAGRIGVFATGRLLDVTHGAVRLYARASYEHDFLDGDRTLTVTPAGAPISFTGDLRERDDDYLSFEANFAVPLLANVEFNSGVSGEVFRSDEANYTLKLGLSVSF